VQVAAAFAHRLRHEPAHLDGLVHVVVAEETLTSARAQVGDPVHELHDLLQVTCVVQVIDRIGEGHATREGVDHLFFLDQIDRRQVLDRDLTQRVDVRLPDLITDAASDLGTDHRFVLRRAVRAEVLELRDAVHGEVLLGKVDPVVRRDLRLVDLEIDEDDRDVVERADGLLDFIWRCRHDALGHRGDRDRRDVFVGRHEQPLFVLLILDLLDQAVFDVHLDRGRVGQHRAAHLLDLALVAARQLADTAELGIDEFGDQRARCIALAGAPQCLDDRVAQVEQRDALRRPVCGDLGRRHLPGLLRVLDEEDAREALAETARDPLGEVAVLEAADARDLEEADPRIVQHAREDREGIEALEDVLRLQRVVEELAEEHDPRETVRPDLVVAEHLLHVLEELLLFGVEAVGTVVEAPVVGVFFAGRGAVSLLEGVGHAADHGLAFEHRHTDPGLRHLIGAGTGRRDRRRGSVRVCSCQRCLGRSRKRRSGKRA
jgi:hypothetical protein